jgi:hemerythrin-like domain-containing protein
MKPSEVRERVLAEHEALRRQLARLEERARLVAGGASDAAPTLRAEGTAFLALLGEHMRWEEQHLVPALRALGARGREQATALVREHAEQRELLDDALARLRDGARPSLLVARNLLDLAALLREDMEREEQARLDPRLLRDAEP